jgi:hypothetical protein
MKSYQYHGEKQILHRGSVENRKIPNLLRKAPNSLDFAKNSFLTNKALNQKLKPQLYNRNKVQLASDEA